MSVPSIDNLPGYRRRFIVTPRPGVVRSELEDDFHCMGVTLRHANGIADSVEAVVVRAPWTTCPGAEAQLAKTFAHAPLAEFFARGEKNFNCTHLYDLAMLAAAHADDADVLTYDILVSDPDRDGRRRAEIRRNGVPVLGFVDVNHRIVEPAELAGVELLKMRSWIDALDPDLKEAARLLRWGALVAHGRTIPMERQSDARHMPRGNCYTFQDERVAVAKRVGEIRDFSTGSEHPLDRRDQFDRVRTS